MGRRLFTWTVLALALWTIAGEVWPESMPRPAQVLRASLEAGTANRLVYNASGTGLLSDLSAITASRALESDASGLPSASSVTSTELSYLSGVTSAVQTQITANSTAIAALREKLSADRTYYVNASTGSDSNTGLSSGTAFATIQKGVDVVMGIDTGGNTVSLSIADGAYASFAINKTLVGTGTFTIVGNTSTPANVTVTGTAGPAISCTRGCRVTVSGITISTNTGSALNGLAAGGNSTITASTGIRFGAVTGSHILANGGGAAVDMTVSYTIAGNATVNHMLAQNGGRISTTAGITVTLSGTPTYATFARASSLALIEAGSPTTYSGSGTGTRYLVDLNAVINTFAQGATLFPGTIAGTAPTGGQYN